MSRSGVDTAGAELDAKVVSRPRRTACPVDRHTGRTDCIDPRGTGDLNPDVVRAGSAACPCEADVAVVGFETGGML